jgi:hypothetical protein
VSTVLYRRTVGAAPSAIEFGYIVGVSNPGGIAPGEDLEVMEFTVCLGEGTTAGEYPLVLERGEIIDFVTATSVPAQLIPGTLTVLEDVAEGSGCQGVTPGGCTPVPSLPPSELEGRFALGEVSALPGEEIAVPFIIWGNSPVQGYSVSIDFDEGVLQGVAVERAFQKPDGSAYGFFASYIDNDDANPGSGGVDEGTVTAAVVFSFSDNCNNIPAGVETEALRLRFRVDEGAESGESLLRFIDGGQSAGQTVRNNLTADGQPVPIELMHSFVLLSGSVTIQAEITLFIRGDANGDGGVELSDAQATLNYLFLGIGRPHCYDAADSNDDGRIDITDVFYTLNFLFLGGPELPAPAGAPGADPTEDGFGCLFKTST